MSGNAKLKIGTKEYDFPIKKGSVGPSVIDVSKLYAETDHFTFDQDLHQQVVVSPNHIHRW